jgi:DNA-binding transcriptional LysR family regulator
MKARNLKVSLKQWKMFHAVIDSDGFFGAADRLNVTQSTISHAVAKLQDQLGVPLLVLKGRKAEITDAGRILLERSRHLISSAMELEELADSLRQGWEPEVRLVVDPAFPSQMLTLALRKFVLTSQKIRLNVRQATHDQIRHALEQHTADLAITSWREAGFHGSAFFDIEHVAVAHPESLLHALKRDITSEELRMHCQVSMSGVDDYVATETGYRAIRRGQVWHVSNIDRAISVLRQSFGYAWLPRHQIQEALADNQVRILPLVDGSSYRSRLFLLHGQALALDSAAGRFAAFLLACSRHDHQEGHGAPAPEAHIDPACCHDGDLH